MDSNVIGIGSEIKLNLNIEPINGITMDDYDFIVEVYCKAKNAIVIKKSDAIREDASNYVLCLDTALLGNGTIKCKVEAQIPDKDFADGYRTEVVFVETGITIIKSI